MPLELKVPQVGESITEVQIGRWLKKQGDPVEKGETLVEIETDKVTVELPAPESGRLGEVIKGDGAAATVGEVIGYLEEAGEAAGTAPEAPAAPRPKAEAPAQEEPARRPAPKEEEAPSRRVAPEPKPEEPAGGRERPQAEAPRAGGPARDVGPAVARKPEPGRVAPAAARARGPAPAAAPVSEKQILKPPGPPETLPRPPRPAVPAREAGAPAAPAPGRAEPSPGEAEEQIVPMSPLRRRIAERLVQAQQTAALLTTFNEVDMSAVMSLRARHQQSFQDKYGIKLGIMSFFVKAAIDALKRFPQLNAEIRGTDIVFRNHYDIGVAVSTDKGLVVPVLAGAERMSFAEIEVAVADFAGRARENKLMLAELEGGTFTITNGGVFGSLLSTPIINPPQSGILGLHAIQDRPVARDGQVVIRPMMYVALTYDHRIVDGREAVTFLRRIKEVIEEPSRMLVEI